MAKSNGWSNGFKKSFRELFNLLVYGSRDGIDCMCNDIVYLRDTHATKRDVEIELHFKVKINEDKSTNNNSYDSQANLENGSN